MTDETAYKVGRYVVKTFLTGVALGSLITYLIMT